MENEYYDDEIEYYIVAEDEYLEYISSAEDQSSSIYPDPLFIAAVTCLFCLIVFGILSKLTVQLFGSVSEPNSSTQLIDQNETNPDQFNISAWGGDCQVSARYPQKITRWCNLITQYSTKHNLNPDLIAALIWLESGGNELAYSHSGAVGLMQVMPRDGLAASFMCANGPCFRDRPSSDELRDPEYNIAFGTRYLSSLLRRNGNLREALKSYGPMDAGYTYSDKVLSIFNQYKNN